MNCFFVCLLNFLPHLLTSLLSSFLMLSFLLVYFLLVYFLTYLSTPSRIDPFRFQAGGVGGEQTGFFCVNFSFSG